MEQSRRRYGSRISTAKLHNDILGLWQVGKSFEYGLVQGGFKGGSYLKVMNWIAGKAASLLQETGKLTVVVQDNSPIHRSKEVSQHWERWSKQGLLLFFLPSYSPELNRVETQWHQLKAHEIAGQIFDNEYDLAMTVIEGMKNRSERGRLSFRAFYI